MATRSPNNQEISRTEIQAALAKAVELRALHAALVQGNSPGKLKPQTCPSPSGSRHSAQDYPVFTPTYEEETVPAYQQIKSDPRRMSLNWDEGQADEVESIGTEKGSPVIAMRRRSGLFSRGPASSTMEHSLSTSSSIRNVTGLQSSLGNATPHALKPNLNSTVERKKILNGANSTVSCNRCKPAALGRENPTVVPLTESQDMIELPQKDRSGNGLFKSWLFSRAKKKTAKTQTSPNNFDPAYISQSMEEWGMALEALKQKLLEANENRDSAVTEVAELRSSMGELEKKLRQLELYCQDLKHALNQTVQDGNVAVTERSGVKNYEEAITCRYADEEHVDRVGSRNPLPVSSEAMVEGFLQIVSEARVSVKQFCRTLVTQIQELDGGAMENLNSLLQPYNVSVTSRVSRGVMYHLESLINQAIYQDFENCSFQKNGSQTILDTQESCQANFDSFASLRNLSWNEVLSKGNLQNIFVHSESTLMDTQYQENWEYIWVPNKSGTLNTRATRVLILFQGLCPKLI